MNEELETRYDRRKQRTRTALKKAAAELLSKKGYEDLTIQDITDQLDVARATFYIYFHDKDDILWSLLQDRFAQLSEALQTKLSGQPFNRHQQKLRLIFEYAAEERELLAVMVSDRGHITLTRRFTRYIAAIIKSDIENGFTPHRGDVPIDFTAHYLAGALLQVLTWWLESDTPFSPDQIAEMFYKQEYGTDSSL